MVDSEISFDKIVDEVKKVTDLSLLNPKNIDKWGMSHVIHYSNLNNTLAIPFEADTHSLLVLQYVRTKSKNWGTVLSDDYISNEFRQLIYELKIDETKYGQIGKTIKEWLKKLETIPRINFRFVLPVNNVEYMHDLDLGKVKLQKMTLEKLKQIVPFFDDKKIDIFSSCKVLEDIVKSNQTDIFAVIEVQAKDEEQGEQLANEQLHKLIYIMKLFNPGSFITERIGYFPFTQYHPLIVNIDKKTFSTPYSNIHITAHVWPKKEYWVKVQDQWDTLVGFLYSETPNELQSLILNGLFWYGEAAKETETNLSKFLKYLHGLETLVIFDKEFGKGTRFADRLTKIFKIKDKENLKKTERLLKKYYEMRSGTIHAGQFSVDNEDVGTTNYILRSLLFKYIELSKKYNNVKDMFVDEFSIDIDAKVTKSHRGLLGKISNLFRHT